MKRVLSILVAVTLIFSNMVGLAAAAPKPLKNKVVFEAPINQVEGTFYDELTMGKEYTFFRTTEVRGTGNALIRTKISFTEATRLEGGDIVVNVKINDEYVDILTTDELKERKAQGLNVPQNYGYGAGTDVNFEVHPKLYIDKKPNLDIFINHETHTYEYMDKLESSGRFVFFGEPLKIVFNTTKIPVVTVGAIQTECPKIYENAKLYIEENIKMMESSKIPFDKSKMVFSILDVEQVKMVSVDANAKLSANSNLEYLKETKRIADEMTAKYQGVEYSSRDFGYKADKKDYNAVMNFYVHSGKYVSEVARAHLEFLAVNVETTVSRLAKYNNYINAKPVKVALVRCPSFDSKYEEYNGQINALKIVNSDKTVNVLNFSKIGNNVDLSGNDIRPLLSSEELKKDLNREKTIFENDFLYSKSLFKQAFYFDKDYKIVSEAANRADENLIEGLGAVIAGTYKNDKQYAKFTTEELKNKQSFKAIRTNVITGKEMVIDLSKSVVYESRAGFITTTNVSYKEGTKTITKPITIISTYNKMFFYIDGKRIDLVNIEIES